MGSSVITVQTESYELRGKEEEEGWQSIKRKARSAIPIGSFFLPLS
jgi:hypothetical protein